MRSQKDKAVILSAKAGLPRLLGGAPESGLTVLLFHRFIFDGEPLETARERLRGQLDFLARRFTPVRLTSATLVGPGPTGGKPPVLVTIDDAIREIVDFVDLFDSFGIPVAQFVCAGWTARASASYETDPSDGERKARIVAWLRFYDGPSETIELGQDTYPLDPANIDALVDAVLAADPAQLDALAAREARERQKLKDRTICTWAELRDLQSAGMVMGCHSVSHPRIAQQTGTRQAYEIQSSRTLIEAHLGPCPWFAYPYGTPDAHSQATYALTQETGFEAAFTTQPALVQSNTDPLRLPRIAMPDKAMDQSHFEARATGGNVPFARMKEWIS